MGVQLGETYEDKIHHIKGVATARSAYLTGCSRILLERMNDDNIIDLWIDETRLMGPGLPEPIQEPGGPGAVAPSRDPVR